MKIEEEGQMISKGESEFITVLRKGLQILKGRQVLIDASEGILENELYKSFEYKFFQNCEKENLLDFQDENNAEAPTICMNLNDIYNVAVDNSVDGSKVENIEIQLKDEFTIRLKLKG